jgi:hypothetical protein
VSLPDQQLWRKKFGCYTATTMRCSHPDCCVGPARGFKDSLEQRSDIGLGSGDGPKDLAATSIVAYGCATSRGFFRRRSAAGAAPAPQTASARTAVLAAGSAQASTDRSTANRHRVHHNRSSRTETAEASAHLAEQRTTWQSSTAANPSRDMPATRPAIRTKRRVLPASSAARLASAFLSRRNRPAPLDLNF